MNEYIFDVASQQGKIDWPGALQRSDAFPLDRSSLFSSLEDAEKYITGTASDERKLGATSYIGQIISVYDAQTKQVRPYLVQALIDSEGSIVGRYLQALILDSDYIDGGNAESAEQEYISRLTN